MIGEWIETATKHELYFAVALMMQRVKELEEEE